MNFILSVSPSQSPHAWKTCQQPLASDNSYEGRDHNALLPMPVI